MTQYFIRILLIGALVGMSLSGCVGSSPSPYEQKIENAKNASTEKEKIAVVEKNGVLIKYIDNPSEAVQLAAVRNYGWGLEDIPDPSEAVKLAAVRNHGSSIVFIKNPSEAVKLAAVRASGQSIKYIDDPSEEVQLAAVNQDVVAMLFIKNPSEAVQLAVLEKDGSNISLIKNPSEAATLVANESRIQADKKIEIIRAEAEESRAKAEISMINNKCNKSFVYKDVNNADIAYQIGQLYAGGVCVNQDYDKSAIWYKIAAEKKHPDAQYALAAMYAEGKGVSKDYLKAAHLFEEAAKDRIWGAHINACYMYDDAAYYTQAVKCYQEDINSDHASFRTSALNNLAVHYDRGEGVKLNKMKAYKLYMEAVKNGSVDAQHNLDKLCKQSSWACK